MKLIFLVLLFLVSFVSSLGKQIEQIGKTVSVCLKSGDCDFTGMDGIQKAVDNVGVGTVINVYAGVYQGAVINKLVHIVGHFENQPTFPTYVPIEEVEDFKLNVESPEKVNKKKTKKTDKPTEKKPTEKKPTEKKPTEKPTDVAPTKRKTTSTKTKGFDDLTCTDFVSNVYIVEGLPNQIQNGIFINSNYVGFTLTTKASGSSIKNINFAGNADLPWTKTSTIYTIGIVGLGCQTIAGCTLASSDTYPFGVVKGVSLKCLNFMNMRNGIIGDGISDWIETNSFFSLNQMDLSAVGVQATVSAVAFNDGWTNPIISATNPLNGKNNCFLHNQIQITQKSTYSPVSAFYIDGTITFNNTIDYNFINLTTVGSAPINSIGIFDSSAGGNTFYLNTINEFCTGIQIKPVRVSGGNIIHSNVLTSNNVGILISDAGLGNSIKYNEISLSSQYGLETCGNYDIIISNDITGSGTYDIYNNNGIGENFLLNNYVTESGIGSV